jgi:hypothetical protein
MVLSDAFLQSSKNAWQRDDSTAAIEALRAARDALRRASSLDPRREDVRRLLDDRERRLARALARESRPR